MTDAREENTGNATSFGEALREALEVVIETQQLTEVTCPHPDCSGGTFAPILNSDEDMGMVSSVATSDDDHEGRCSEGHTAFVHY